MLRHNANLTEIIDEFDSLVSGPRPYDDISHSKINDFNEFASRLTVLEGVIQNNDYIQVVYQFGNVKIFNHHDINYIIPFETWVHLIFNHLSRYYQFKYDLIRHRNGGCTWIDSDEQVLSGMEKLRTYLKRHRSVLVKAQALEEKNYA